MHPLVEHGAVRAALAGIAEVGLVVEDVVDAVHREVVRHEEEQRADHERGVDLPRREQVGGGERIGGVDPADGPRGEQQLPGDG